MRVMRVMRLMGLVAVYQRRTRASRRPSTRSRRVVNSADQPGLARRHHLHPDGQGLSLPGGHHGSGEPRRAGWRLSNTLSADFCVEALEEALAQYGKPEIFNPDQGCQFTSTQFTGVLEQGGITINMGGKGRCMDNIFVERLWRSLKYQEVYLHAYASVAEAKAWIGAWLRFYNEERQHQSHAYRTPRQVYEEGLWICGRSALPTGSACPLPEQTRKAGKCSPSPTSPQAPPPAKDLILMR